MTGTVVAVYCQRKISPNQKTARYRILTDVCNMNKYALLRQFAVAHTKESGGVGDLKLKNLETDSFCVITNCTSNKWN